MHKIKRKNIDNRERKYRKVGTNQSDNSSTANKRIIPVKTQNREVEQLCIFSPGYSTFIQLGVLEVLAEINYWESKS